MQIENEELQQSKHQPKSSSPASKLKALDSKEIIRLEYEQLNQWARHGEEAAHRIFNFYVSLLTAMLGGFLLITQIITGSLETILLFGSAICGLLVIIGVTFLDALMGQYSRNIHYRIGIEKIRRHFRLDPRVSVILSKLPIATLEADSETFFYTLVEGRMATPQIKRTPCLVRLIVLLFPISTQQIFLSMVTSLLIGALIWLLVWGITGVIDISGKLLLASGLAVVLSFLIQNIIVRIGLQGALDQLREILSAHTENPRRQKQRQSKRERKASRRGERDEGDNP